ncbi:MAG: Stp1/IreP family PP2C-type Ser/Thr phosphatase [Acidimicrobiales bacterium]
MRFAWGSATDVGRVRTNNQDSFLVAPAMWAVADGMGGHRGGEVASHVAIETLASSYDGDHPSIAALRGAAEVANSAVHDRAGGDAELQGMGTTLVAIAPVEGDDGESLLAWINIGDSRLYLLRDGEIEQISEDHSLVEEMVRDGRISADEAKTHPQRNILTRALGIDVEASIDTGSVIPYSGDRYLLCSDGLFNEVDEARMAATLRRLDDPNEAAQELVRLALEGGGRDNITVVILNVLDDDGAAAKASSGIAAGTAEGHADRVPAPPPPPPASAAEPSRSERRTERRAANPRRLTLRVVLFLLIVLAVVGGTAVAVFRVARGGYTVKARGTSVVIYHGNGDHVLWLRPSIEEDLGTITVQPRYQQDVAKGQHFDSLNAAKAYAAQLATNQAATTTTTTSVPPSTAPTTTIALAPP